MLYTKTSRDYFQMKETGLRGVKLFPDHSHRSRLWLYRVRISCSQQENVSINLKIEFTGETEDAQEIGEDVED